ncbi:MAG: 3-hydroxyacyl-CoA dehydrogenase NAD-binding domain-containing protein [Pseudomonadota bacterium]
MECNLIGVIGAGIRGSGIAQVCAQAGRKVVMLDVADGAVELGLGSITALLTRSVKKGRINEDEKNAAVARVRGTTLYADLACCDVVIEPTRENEALKLNILKQVEAVLRPSAIIATNTSSISIAKLAAASSYPNRLIGMPFFNPVPVLALVELIRGLTSSDDSHECTKALAIAIGSSSISNKNGPGFAVNRILCAMINESITVLQEGLACAEQIDEGMTLAGAHSLGPLALADLIGLDTLLSVLQTFFNGVNDPKYQPAALLCEMVDAGRLGRKSGQGFYRYA